MNYCRVRVLELAVAKNIAQVNEGAVSMPDIKAVHRLLHSYCVVCFVDFVLSLSTRYDGTHPSLHSPTCKVQHYDVHRMFMSK